ncbi:MAG: serine/threonine protein kinase [Planctomycetes bacterium]|jgi:serine/threonine-protein kinase|nr:serine/threonine protein kinase [Planctomycetota bacterium]HNZ66047.1 serine/threonine-protein kinase [Planctomycetota bacterium]HON45155.1 serine/threonine-protein kinase [Planctomycetota bacterium]HPY74725.1 serine/threonine-protein kinase [Planctomycetota bacterium]HQA99732.1 serine/threonine-protein kinase [Planctomycetota bacterium]
MEENRIAGYQLCRTLGKGSMGTVYLAINIATNREVALKVLDKELSHDPRFVNRFLREARNVAKLKNHENIVEAYDFGEYQKRYYFAMEYVPGKSLAQLIFEQGKLSERMALVITMKVASALEHASYYSIVHRDIKPENILISQEGTVKLCDLGLAKDLTWDGTNTREGIMLGTACYAAPEQIAGKLNVDGRADIYSLGVTLYHMLTGVDPFENKKSRDILLLHASNKPAFVPSTKYGISNSVLKLIKKMTAKNPDERHQTPKEVLLDIEYILLNPENIQPRPVYQPKKIVLEKRKWRFHLQFISPSHKYIFILIAEIIMIIFICLILHILKT